MEIKVESIDKFNCKDWLVNKHYAKRVPPIIYSFGLYIDNVLNGVCTFGMPARCFNNGYACFGNDFKINTIELNRLVVNDGLPKNTLSFFVSKCLNMLPKPCCVISYADPNNGHQGYIYQATNWIYTGINSDYIVKFYDENMKEIHARSVVSKYGTADRKEVLEKFNITSKKETSKHRYFKFLGSRKDIKNMYKNLKYEIKVYPKGDNKRYDASYSPNIQVKLF